MKSGENRKSLSGNLLPCLVRVLLAVDAKRNQPHIQLCQIVPMPRELAQFGHAVGSPISTIEEEQHPMPTLNGELEVFAVLVL